MSGAIRDVEKFNQLQLETVKRRQARELNSIQNAHSAIKADMTKTHEAELVDITQENQQLINEATSRKEKILDELRTTLQHSKDLTEKELKNLQTRLAAAKNDQVTKNSIERERLNNENELFLEDINDRYNLQVQKINHEGQNRVNEATNAMHEQFLASEKFHQDKVNKQNQEFTTRFVNDGRRYQTQKDLQDGNFKREREATNSRQQLEMKKMTETHSHHIEKRDDNYRKGLKDQDLFFEKKYEGQLQSHRDQFKRLEDLNKKVVDELKSSLTKELTTSATRNDDPFYKFESLKPELKDLEDRVEISVKVSDHAKQDLQLSINGKEAIVNFNRRYTDASKTPDGAINKVNKVESYSTRLQSRDFLDPKTVKSSYDGGVMRYVIKKA